MSYFLGNIKKPEEGSLRYILDPLKLSPGGGAWSRPFAWRVREHAKGAVKGIKGVEVEAA